MNYRWKLIDLELENADPAAFWYRVNALIREKKYTQKVIADKIGVQYPRFRGWSHRNFYPDFNKIYAIAQVLDTTINYLVFGVDKPASKNSHLICESLLNLIKLIVDEFSHEAT